MSKLRLLKAPPIPFTSISASEMNVWLIFPYSDEEEKQELEDEKRTPSHLRYLVRWGYFRDPSRIDELNCEISKRSSHRKLEITSVTREKMSETAEEYYLKSLRIMNNLHYFKMNFFGKYRQSMPPEFLERIFAESVLKVNNRHLRKLCLQGVLNDDAVERVGRVLGFSKYNNQTVTHIDFSDNSITSVGCSRFVMNTYHSLPLVWLDLSKNRLTNDVFDALALFTPSLTFLDVSFTILFGGELSGGKGLVDFLKHSVNLKTLNLSGNNMSTTEFLAHGLRNATKLQSLWLNYNKIAGLECRRLCLEGLRFNYSLTELQLASNQISDFGFVEIAHLLQEGKGGRQLRSLDISNNECMNAGMRTLASSLVFNQTLTELKLGSNLFASEAIHALGKALEKNQSLLSLSLAFNLFECQEGLLSLCQSLTLNSTLTHLDVQQYQNIVEFPGYYMTVLAILEKNNRSITSLELIPMFPEESTSTQTTTTTTSLQTLYGAANYEQMQKELIERINRFTNSNQWRATRAALEKSCLNQCFNEHALIDLVTDYVVFPINGK